MQKLKLWEKLQWLMKHIFYSLQCLKCILKIFSANFWLYYVNTLGFCPLYQSYLEKTVRKTGFISQKSKQEKSELSKEKTALREIKQ